MSSCRVTTDRLACHIKRCHRCIPAKRRHHLTTIATVVKRKAAPALRPKDTPSLLTLFSKAAQEEAKNPRATEVQVQQIAGTRSFPRFPNDHPMIAKFITFLRSLDGRRKSDSESVQFANDVSKYSRFTHQKSENPNYELNWTRLTN